MNQPDTTGDREARQHRNPAVQQIETFKYYSSYAI